MLNNVMNNALSGINARPGRAECYFQQPANAGVGYYHRQSAVFGETGHNDNQRLFRQRHLFQPCPP